MSIDDKHIRQIEVLQKKLLKLDKLASLGTLSAGIMHEIQNPMNFILNFSNMSEELTQELTDYVESIESLSDDDREELADITSMLSDNLKKVVEHSKRANQIIQGMLAYSRGKKSDKLLVDLNELVHRFVNLGYHAMRANHKDFNVKITERFEDKLPKVSAVEQDLGRAVLNLVNNACYAVYEKAQTLSNDYKPELRITTALANGKVEIIIEDNGNGIPDDILENIYQPFFSTKPDRAGTGLGLTITREIVEEDHEGALEVETKEGEGTIFRITLPID